MLFQTLTSRLTAAERRPLVPVEAAKEIAAKVPGAEVIIVPGLSQNVPVQLVPIFADAIDKAVQRATRP